jgi:hypothetical protein
MCRRSSTDGPLQGLDDELLDDLRHELELAGESIEQAWLTVSEVLEVRWTAMEAELAVEAELESVRVDPSISEGGFGDA